MDIAKTELSVVIPLYNEAESINDLYKELSLVLNSLGKFYEVIIIDDGSKDDSFSYLKAIHQRDPRWQVIRFRRNFGQTAAFSAGFLKASGQVVVTIDADLQNDPRDIPRLLDKLDEGYDIVSGWRINRKEPFLNRRLPSILANRLISKMTGITLHDYGCSLKAYRRHVIKNMRLYGELHRLIPGIASWMGVSVTEVAVNDRARKYGKSKYGINRTFKVLLDMIIVKFLLDYATRPIHVFGGTGLIAGLCGGIFGLYLIIVKLVLGREIGHHPLFFLTFLLASLSVVMIGMGVLAEMVMRTYNESQNRQIYVVKEQLTITEKSSLEVTPF